MPRSAGFGTVLDLTDFAKNSTKNAPAAKRSSAAGTSSESAARASLYLPPLYLPPDGRVLHILLRLLAPAAARMVGARGSHALPVHIRALFSRGHRSAIFDHAYRSVLSTAPSSSDPSQIFSL